MPQTYRDFGLILKRTDLGEADAIVTLLTRQEGVARAVAKGVRKLTSRKGGNVALFNHIDALVTRGRSLDVLSEAEAIATFNIWRSDLERVSQAYYAADITIMLLAEGETYSYIHDQLVSFYGWLGYALVPSLLVRWYEVQLLVSLGFWAANQMQSESQNALTLLDSFAQETASSVAQMRTAPRLTQEMERLMRDRLVQVLERDPKSQNFVFQVQALGERLAQGAA